MHRRKHLVAEATRCIALGAAACLSAMNSSSSARPTSDKRRIPIRTRKSRKTHVSSCLFLTVTSEWPRSTHSATYSSRRGLNLAGAVLPSANFPGISPVAA